MQSQPNRVGEVLGNYRLVKRIGKGGYAEVYLAENIHLGTQAAIKLLRARALQDYEQEQLREEASVMMTLDHPHIARVLDFGIEVNKRGIDGSTPYLVMEYAPLGTLRHLYPRGTPMPLPKVVSYIKQVAEALQYAHDHTPVIVHHDVKPENMLVRRPDDVALSDFGIAVSGMATGNLESQMKQILEKVTRNESVTIPGTAAYLAPERLQGHTQRASDQYSLAIVAYEWLCGHPPFDGNDLELCNKHVNAIPQSLSKNFSHIPQDVDRVIMKALAKQPGDRYESIQKFALALEIAARSTVQKPSPVFPTSGPVSQPVLQSPQRDNHQIQQIIPWWTQESQPYKVSVHAYDPPQEQRADLAPTSPIASPLRVPSTVLFPQPELPDEELKDFFISHCKADDSWASWIAWELEEANYSTILPAWDFRAGSDLERQMQKAAAKTRCGIVVLSPDYFNSRTTLAVRNVLLGLDALNKQYLLLPVLVRECGSELKEILEPIRCIGFIGLDEAEARAKLLAEVRGERPKPKKRPVYPGSTLNHTQSEKPSFPQKQSVRTRVLIDRSLPTPAESIEIFFSYSHRDEALRRELEIYLSTLKRRYPFMCWYDRNIDAGSDFESEIDRHLKTAHIILLLVTQSFIASDYCYNIEMTQALERHKAGEAVVVPIILRPALWEKTPFGKLQALPKNGKAVTTSPNPDEAFVEIAEGIEILINRIIGYV